MSDFATHMHQNNSFRKSDRPNEFQKIVKLVGSYKWLFIVCIILGLAAAFLINRFTTPVYMAATSIMLKETDNGTRNPGSMLLSKDGAGDGGAMVNKSQEMAVLASYPFILKTLEALNFQVSYFEEGPFFNIELYNEAPFNVVFIDTAKYKSISGRKFKVHFEEDGSFRWTSLANKNDEGVLVKVDQAILVNGCPIRIAKTDAFHSGVVGKDYIVAFHDLSSLAFDYKNRLGISSEEESSILQLSLETNNPQKGVAFLNEFSKQYLINKYEEKSRAATQALAFINEQIASVRGSLGSAETSLANFKASTTFTDAGEMASRSLNALSQLDEERAVLALNERYYNKVLADLNQNTGLDQLMSPSQIGIQDGLTEGIIKQLADLQIEKNSYAASGNAKNPLVADIDIKINNLKNTLRDNIRSLSATNKMKMSQVEARAGGFRAQVYNIPTAEKKFTDIKRTSDFNDELYQFLMQKRVEAGILKASATIENKVVEPPYVAGVPLAPKTGRNYVIGFILGFVLPLGFLKIKESLNHTVSGKEEITDRTSIPVIGTVYHSSDKNAIVINQASRTAVSESFRILRSNITYFLKDKEKKVITVSSTNSGEGKSFTSINTALSFALAKKHTILLNMDLRVPSTAYNELGGNNNNGVSEYLDGTASLQQIIQSTENSYLDYIATGTLPINPAELLMDSRLKNLIEQLQDMYEFVIIDTPPLGIVADPLIIAAYSKLNILVVRDKFTTKESIADLDMMYQEGKIKDVVMVLNDLQLSKKGYSNAYYYKTAKA